MITCALKTPLIYRQSNIFCTSSQVSDKAEEETQFFPQGLVFGVLYVGLISYANHIYFSPSLVQNYIPSSTASSALCR